VQIARQWATHGTGSYAQQDSSCVERASWLLRMPFSLEANYIFLRTSHFFSLCFSLGLPPSFRYHHLVTSTAANRGCTNTSGSWAWNRIEQNDGRFCHTPPAETDLQCRHHSAHHDTANAATENITVDAELNIVRKTGSSKNKKQQAIRCEYSQVEVDDRQLRR